VTEQLGMVLKRTEQSMLRAKTALPRRVDRAPRASYVTGAVVAADGGRTAI